jgi:hypothetical protein
MSKMPQQSTMNCHHGIHGRKLGHLERTKGSWLGKPQHNWNKIKCSAGNYIKFDMIRNLSLDSLTNNGQTQKGIHRCATAVSSMTSRLYTEHCSC